MNRIQDKSPIIITGCARSGASMVAGAFIKCGAFGGAMNNQFENLKIHNEIVPEYLSSENSKVKVLVVPTDEELMIARDTFEIIS